MPQSIDLVTVKRVSLKAIRTGWDELLRIVASIRLGRLSAELALRYLSSAVQGDPAYEAAENLGRLLRSVFLCDFVTIDDFRREIHTLLSRGESVHLLQRAIYDGKVATDRGRRRDEMRTISGAHALLTNIVIGWEHEPDERGGRATAQGRRDDRGRLDPAHGTGALWEHQSPGNVQVWRGEVR